MTLAAFAELAEIIGAFGVIAGLVFVGVQLRQNTLQLRRAETNVTNTEASVIRQSILLNSEVAELVTVSMTGSRALSEVEMHRLTAFFWEVGYQAIQFWDRTKNGLFPRTVFDKTIVVYSPYLTSLHGLNWWRFARTIYEPDFVVAIERAIPALTPMEEPAS